MKVTFDVRSVGNDQAGPRAILEGWFRGWVAAFPDDEVEMRRFDQPPSGLDVLRGKLGLWSTNDDGWTVLCSPTVRAAVGGSPRVAIVCHDFRHVEQPERFSRYQLMFRKLVWERAYRSASIVIANSEESRQALLSRIPDADVHVLTWAPSVTGIAAGGDRGERSGVLAVAHRANKPPSRAIDVWHDAFPDPDHRPPLTILAGELASTVASEPGLTVLSHVPDSTYHRLFRESVAVLYLSDFEGLGLPCFEAMAASTPIVTSDLPIFRTNLGDDYSGLTAEPEAVLVSLVREVERWDHARTQLQTAGERRESQLRAQLDALRGQLSALA